MKPPPPKPRFSPIAVLALTPLLLVLAFARISGTGPGGTPVFPAPVHVIEDPAADPTSARRLLSPALFALPGAFGFSSDTLHRTAPRIHSNPSPSTSRP